MYLLNVLLVVLMSPYLSHRRCSTWQSENFKWCTQTGCCMNVCYYILLEKFSAQPRKWSGAANSSELPQIGVKLKFLSLMMRQSNLPEQIVSKSQDYCSAILKVDSYILVGKRGSAGKKSQVIFSHWTCSVL